MKTLIFSFALALGAAGCLGVYTPGEPTGGGGGGADMAHVSTGTGGNGTGTGGGNGTGTGGGGGSTDMATQASGGGSDGGVVGTKAFGDTCAVDGDCQTGMCRQFVMGTVHRCTKPCNAATSATDCPAPSAGTCTNPTPPDMPYCKFTQ
jgi:hypothetical protein